MSEKDKQPQKQQSRYATVVAYQGEPGAYSECAIYGLLGDGVEARGYSSFEEAFKATEDGEVRIKGQTCGA